MTVSIVQAGFVSKKIFNVSDINSLRVRIRKLEKHKRDIKAKSMFLKLGLTPSQIAAILKVKE